MREITISRRKLSGKNILIKTSDGDLGNGHVQIDEAAGYRLYFVKIEMIHNQHVNILDVVPEVISKLR